MAQLTRAQLKALWISGYKPTHSDYSDLFDSILNLLDDELQMFDATVGTGGNYSTFAAAKLDGKNRLKLVSNITENITISDFTILDFNGYRIIGNVTVTGNYMVLRDQIITGTFRSEGSYCLFENIRANLIENIAGANYNKFVHCQSNTTPTDAVATTFDFDVIDLSEF